MTTNYAEFKRQVLLKFPSNTDGRTLLAVEQAINEAQRCISRVRDFDELMVTDTANAHTHANQASYHIESNLALTRPKDIYSIRLMANEESRKLEFVPYREKDERIPYPEQSGTGKSRFYCRRGMYIELYRIPDDTYPLYITHSSWPANMANDSDTTLFSNIDDVIVALATDIASSIIEGQGVVGNWVQRAQQLLGISLSEEATRPDVFWIARPFRADRPTAHGEYWNNPWVKHQP